MSPTIDPDVRGAKPIGDLLSKHRESPNCYGCHQKIDPLGFALENFDPVGGWRTKYAEAPIDSADELPTGEKFSDIAGLKKILVERQNRFAHMLTDRLLTSPPAFFVLSLFAWSLPAKRCTVKDRHFCSPHFLPPIFLPIIIHD